MVKWREEKEEEHEKEEEKEEDERRCRIRRNKNWKKHTQSMKLGEKMKMGTCPINHWTVNAFPTWGGGRE